MAARGRTAASRHSSSSSSSGGFVAAAPLLVAALCCAAATLASAKIEYAHVFRDDRPLIAITNAFGFGARGHVDITLRDITLWRRHDQVGEDYNLGNFGFFLSPWDAEMELGRELMDGKCVLDGRDLRIFTFADPKVSAVVEGRAVNVSFHVDVADGGLFTLYFASCEPMTPVSFAARVEAFNLVGPNDRRDYLSVGETELDVMYWVMAGLFAALLAAWAVTLARGKALQQRGLAGPGASNVHAIHWLMLLLLVCKTLTLTAQAAMFHVIEFRGSPHGWNWVYYLFTFLRGSLFFVVVVLIGTGWSLMKPFIDDRTRKVLLVVLPLQVFANIAIIVTSEETPAIRDWLTWQDILHFVDIACCCAILFPIVWSIKQLRDQSETDGKAARALEKLRLFRSFYVVVVVWVYFTRIVVYLLESTLDYRYRWLAQAANELATLMFYVWVGVRFRPSATNPYTRLDPQEQAQDQGGLLGGGGGGPKEVQLGPARV